MAPNLRLPRRAALGFLGALLTTRALATTDGAEGSEAIADLEFSGRGVGTLHMRGPSAWQSSAVSRVRGAALQVSAKLGADEDVRFTMAAAAQIDVGHNDEQMSEFVARHLSDFESLATGPAQPRIDRSGAAPVAYATLVNKARAGSDFLFMTMAVMRKGETSFVMSHLANERWRVARAVDAFCTAARFTAG